MEESVALSYKMCVAIVCSLYCMLLSFVFSLFLPPFSLFLSIKHKSDYYRFMDESKSLTSPMMRDGKTRSVVSVTNFTLKESVNIFITQLNNALKV